MGLNFFNNIVYTSLTCILFFSSCENNSKEKCKIFEEKYSIDFVKKYSSDTNILIKKLNEIIKSDSYCIDALLTRADLFFSMDSLSDARKDYQNVLFYDTANVYSSYKIGMISQLQGNDEVAIKYFLNALNFKSYKEVIVDYRVNEKNQEDSKSKYDIDSHLIQFRLGESYYYLDSLNQALNKFTYCINNNFNLGKAYLYRATIFYQVGKNEMACRDFNEAKKEGNDEAIKYLIQYCNNY